MAFDRELTASHPCHWVLLSRLNAVFTVSPRDGQVSGILITVKQQPEVLKDDLMALCEVSATLLLSLLVIAFHFYILFF